MTKEILSDKEVRRLQKQWDPSNYDNEPNPHYKKVMQAIATIRFNESIEDHRKYLMSLQNQS